jgi:tetratricopeptide (TPR) repeat protein
MSLSTKATKDHGLYPQLHTRVAFLLLGIGRYSVALNYSIACRDIIYQQQQEQQLMDPGRDDMKLTNAILMLLEGQCRYHVNSNSVSHSEAVALLTESASQMEKLLLRMANRSIASSATTSANEVVEVNEQRHNIYPHTQSMISSMLNSLSATVPGLYIDTSSFWPISSQHIRNKSILLSLSRPIIAAREILSQIYSSAKQDGGSKGHKGHIDHISHLIANQVALVTFLSDVLMNIFDGISISKYGDISVTADMPTRKFVDSINTFFKDLSCIFRKHRAQSLFQLGDMLSAGGSSHSPELIYQPPQSDVDIDTDSYFTMYWSLAAQEFTNLSDNINSGVCYSKIGAHWVKLGGIEPYSPSFPALHQGSKGAVKSSDMIAEVAENGINAFISAARENHKAYERACAEKMGEPSTSNLISQCVAEMEILQKELLNYYHAGICGLYVDVDEAVKALEQAKHVQQQYDRVMARYNESNESNKVGKQQRIDEDGYRVACFDICYHLGHAYLSRGSVSYAMDEADRGLRLISAAASAVNDDVKDRKRARLAHELRGLCFVSMGQDAEAEAELVRMQRLCVGPVDGNNEMIVVSMMC